MPTGIPCKGKTENEFTDFVIVICRDQHFFFWRRPRNNSIHENVIVDLFFFAESHSNTSRKSVTWWFRCVQHKTCESDSIIREDWQKLQGWSSKSRKKTHDWLGTSVRVNLVATSLRFCTLGGFLSVELLDFCFIDLLSARRICFQLTLNRIAI